jgi:hypothetical protein
MPVTIRKVAGKDCVRVTTPNQTHAKCTSRSKAEAQKRIIENADKGKK